MVPAVEVTCAGVHACLSEHVCSHHAASMHTVLTLKASVVQSSCQAVPQCLPMNGMHGVRLSAAWLESFGASWPPSYVRRLGFLTATSW